MSPALNTVVDMHLHYHSGTRHALSLLRPLQPPLLLPIVLVVVSQFCVFRVLLLWAHLQSNTTFTPKTFLQLPLNPLHSDPLLTSFKA